jgi:deoxyribodipyrimidine photolyase-related protein
VQDVRVSVSTVWLLGDQLDAAGPALRGSRPGEARLLMVESAAQLRRLPYVRERRVLVLGAMRRFADARRREGWCVDLRRAPTLADGVWAHLTEHRPDRLVVSHPSSRGGLGLVRRLAREAPVTVEIREPTGFLTRPGELDELLRGRAPRMGTFYREMRLRLGLLLDGTGRPLGGAWSHDAENRRPPPRALTLGVPAPWRPDADDHELRAELDGLEEIGPGGERVMAVTPQEAEQALRAFTASRLGTFGPWQDAMLTHDWAMSHALLSAPLNLGLLSPHRVASAAADALTGGAPLQSVEGLVRQVIGWREYVWGWYWKRDDWRAQNALGAGGPVPAALWGAPTRMRCVQVAVDGVRHRGYAHHIQRLMVLGNLMLLAGTDPWAARRWFRAGFVDAAAWVMAPNVLGMALWADGGAMMTKPYPASGAYISRMSDHCRTCPYRPKEALGELACPFTTLYLDFLDRHRERLSAIPRMLPVLRNLDRRADDMPEIRRNALRTLDGLGAGTV